MADSQLKCSIFSSSRSLAVFFFFLPLTGCKLCIKEAHTVRLLILPSFKL
jgi:hypothetical protein